jgi:hypothetical protein
VHFETNHQFSAARDVVVDVLCDPEFQTHLDLPDLSRPEVVESSTDGTTRVLRLRYEYVGQLDPIARKIVGGRKLTWIQELRLDTKTFAGKLSFASEEDANRLNGEAKVVLTADGGAHCTRQISGDFHVKVPLIGGTAERRIVPGLTRRLEVEAAALATELNSRR